jgi:carboxyl-terminal processing protease
MLQQRSRTFRSLLISVIFLLLSLSSGAVGFLIGRSDVHISKNAPGYITTSTNPDRDTIDFSLFWQAWNTIDKNYYGDTNSKARLNGAIAGMVGGLNDPYSMYFEPSANELFRSDLEGSFDGIGAELTVRDGLLTIVSVLEATPAQKAGLKAQDVILQIDDKKSSELNFNDAIKAIRGPKDSQVKLSIGRAGEEEALSINVTRDKITVKSVKTEDLDGDIAYIKINQFGEDTAGLTQQAFEAAKNKKGIIVDLRDNPGGYLATAIDLIGICLLYTSDAADDM